MPFVFSARVIMEHAIIFMFYKFSVFLHDPGFHNICHVFAGWSDGKLSIEAEFEVVLVPLF